MVQHRTELNFQHKTPFGKTKKIGGGGGKNNGGSVINKGGAPAPPPPHSYATDESK